MTAEVPGSKESWVGVSKENLGKNLRLQRRAPAFKLFGPCRCPRYGETEKT